jgi:hypothetical protein
LSRSSSRAGNDRKKITRADDRRDRQGAGRPRKALGDPKRDVERAYLVDCLEAARVATEWLWRHEEEIRAFVDERRARKAAE